MLSVVFVVTVLQFREETQSVLKLHAGSDQHCQGIVELNDYGEQGDYCQQEIVHTGYVDRNRYHRY